MLSVQRLTIAALILAAGVAAGFVYRAHSQATEPITSRPLEAQNASSVGRLALPKGLSALTASQRRDGSDDAAANLIRSVNNLDFNRDAGTVHADFQQLEKLLQEHPEQLPMLAEQIKALSPEAPFFMERVSFFSGLLAGSAAPQAETLLVDLLDSAVHETIAIQAVAALGDLRQPTVAGGKALLAAYQGNGSPVVRDMALLAYGSVAAQVRGQDAAGPLDESLTTLALAAPTGERLQYLAAMGNSGAAAYLPIIEPYLADSDPLIRARAVYELRKIPGEQTLTLIMKAKDGDSDPGVRGEAAKALAFRRSR